MREKTNYGIRKSPSNSLKQNRNYFLFFEGIVTENQYFEGISDFRKKIGISHTINIFNLNRNQAQCTRTNVKIMISDIEDRKNNAPANDEIHKFDIDNDDRIWIIFDRDNIPKDDIKEAIKYSNENKNHFLGFTNPCFELWLLLHFVDISTLSSSEQIKILENDKISNQYNYAGQKLKNLNTLCIKKGKHILFSEFIDKISNAILNEKKILNSINQFDQGLVSNIGSIVDDMKK